MTGPTVAVCAPVHGDREGLIVLLDALAHCGATTRPDVVVVVSVDGPDPSLEAVARDAGALVVVSEQNRGSYAARNLAADALPTTVRWVLFTDSDCRPQPGWIDAHLRALARHDLSGGAVSLVLPSPPTPAAFLDAKWHLRQDRHVSDGGFAATANLAIRREVLDRFRFDDRLRSGGDRELCRRAVAAGHDLVYTPDAVVLHPARSSARALRAKIDRIADAIPDNPDRPPLPSWSLIELLRLVRGAQRAGAVRTPGQFVELVGLHVHRLRTVRSAILSS